MQHRSGEPVCRSCGQPTVSFLDLGLQPQAGWFPAADDPRPDPAWPLVAAVCTACWLVQLSGNGPDEYEVAGAPVPTSSATMSAHARALVAWLVERHWARPGAATVEVASHGGYLQPFFRERGVDTLAVGPTAGQAQSLRLAGGRVLESTLAGAAERAGAGSTDLIVDHYLFAHLSDPDAAMAGVARLLAPTGVAVLEYDDWTATMAGRQFDAIRHGHRSYLSLTWLVPAAARHGLRVVEAIPQPVYGGAMRVVLRPEGGGGRAVGASVALQLAAEQAAGVADLGAYRRFGRAVRGARRSTREALLAHARAGRPTVAYGAPARAVTLLNYFGLGPAELTFTVDQAPIKQGRFVPGVRLPIAPPERLLEVRPRQVLILAWDLAPEITQQLAAVRAWGGRFLVPIPRLVEV